MAKPGTQTLLFAATVSMNTRRDEIFIGSRICKQSPVAGIEVTARVVAHLHTASRDARAFGQYDMVHLAPRYQ